VDSNPQIRQVVIDASAISHVDASAVQGIIELIKTLKDREIRFLIAEVVGPVRDSMFKTRLMEEIGFENIYLTLNDALESEGKLANRRKARAVQHND
ncbi:MAG: sodium-independent anion transporter, partial [Cyclobacteriaceae bacterium]